MLFAGLLSTFRYIGERDVRQREYEIAKAEGGYQNISLPVTISDEQYQKNVDVLKGKYGEQGYTDIIVPAVEKIKAKAPELGAPSQSFNSGADYKPTSKTIATTIETSDGGTL